MDRGLHQYWGPHFVPLIWREVSCESIDGGRVQGRSRPGIEMSVRINGTENKKG
jgi:hypothetical protein